MNEQQLAKLLSRKEGPTLDFKREWYKLKSTKRGATTGGAKDEMAKDVLSLVNRNSIFADEPSYLIIGADEEYDTEGLHHILGTQDNIEPLQILEIVNSLCTPKIEDIQCNAVYFRGKRLVVITLPPDSNVHATTKALKPNGRKTPIPENAVLIRTGSSVIQASPDQISDLRTAKERWATETRNVKPIVVAVIVVLVSGIVSGLISWTTSGLFASILNQRLGYMLGSVIAGSILGLGFASIFLIYRQVWRNLPTIFYIARQYLSRLTAFNKDK